MSDPKKRLLIRLYFLRPLSRRWLRPPLTLLCIGFALYWTHPGFWLLGTGTLYLGILVTISLLRPSDSTIDRWLHGDVVKLRGKALKMLDLEAKDIEARKPLELVGPLLHITSHISREQIHYRRGKDRCYRLSANKVLILLPTKDYLGIFQCVYDSIRGEVFHLMASEYPYRNVVAVRYGGDAEVFKGEEKNQLTTRDGKPFVPTQFLSISISNGERFGVPVRAQLAQDRAQGPPMTQLEETVRALKKLLQSKFEAT